MKRQVSALSVTERQAPVPLTSSEDFRTVRKQITLQLARTHLSRMDDMYDAALNASSLEKLELIDEARDFVMDRIHELEDELNMSQPTTGDDHRSAREHQLLSESQRGVHRRYMHYNFNNGHVQVPPTKNLVLLIRQRRKWRYTQIFIISL